MEIVADTMIRNYTTQIAVEKTILEIEQLLIKFNAGGIYKEYEGQHIKSLMFYITKDGQKIPFKIPVTIEKTRTVVAKAVANKKLPLKYGSEPLRTEQGERIVWRIIKDWLDSQLSLYEINFADAIEIFLPYAYNAVQDKTMYEQFLEHKEKFIAIEGGGDNRLNRTIKRDSFKVSTPLENKDASNE